MGKEQQLLEAAAAGNNGKVEQILKGKTNPLKRWLSKERLLEEISEQEGSDEPVSLPIITNKLHTPHVEIDCVDESGATPLILAALNGHKEVVLSLITYSANVQMRDYQGNTALHMAAWQNQSTIVELLLLNGASATATNTRGNTALHYACQHCPPGKTLTIIKLLQHGTNVLAANQAGDTSLDLAIRFNRTAAVAVLVDAEPKALESAKFLVNAAKTGKKDVVEILLEAGMDPNSFDHDSGTLPLHESVRFFRKEVACLLLEFGAQPGIKNSDNESAIDIIKSHPGEKADDFLKLLRDQRGKKPRVARVHTEKTSAMNGTDHTDDATLTLVHPRLKSRSCWLQSSKQYCSAFTKKHPCTMLLDGDPFTYWLIPAPGSYNWVAFDFRSEFTLTGIRIYGWGNKKMPCTIYIETGPSLSGPWEHQGRYKADQIGPDEMDMPSEGQDFKGFYATSQYWRMVVADNYGDQITAIGGIEFYGIESCFVEWFKGIGLTQYAKVFVDNGYSQLSEICILTEEQIRVFVNDPAHRKKIVSSAKSLRPIYYPPNALRWAVKPVNKIAENKTMPEFSVWSDPYTVGDVVLLLHGGGQIIGRTRVALKTREDGYMSRANFADISLTPVGNYSLEVQSASDSTISITLDTPIEVATPPKRHSEINRVFQDFENMLNFDV